MTSLHCVTIISPHLPDVKKKDSPFFPRIAPDKCSPANASLVMKEYTSSAEKPVLAIQSPLKTPWCSSR